MITATPASARASESAPALRVERWHLGEGLVDYQEAWERQRALHAEVAAGDRPGTVLMLEHPPMFTAGTSTRPEDRPVDGSPVVDVDRGGRITWHGPGQLVVYPIVRLREPLDVVAFVRALEASVMTACDSLGLPTGRVTGRSGVWVDGTRKVCAVGVRVARQTTMHGLALNCDNDLTWYSRIVPCGISDAGVTTLTGELDRRVSVLDAADALQDALLKEVSSCVY